MTLMERSGFLLAATVALTILGGCSTLMPAPVINRADPSAVSAPGRTHVVRPGDTIYSIAQMYGATVRDLMSWNGLNDPSKLAIGQSLAVSPPQAGQGSAVVAPVATDGGLEARPLAQGDQIKRAPRVGKQPYQQAMATVSATTSDTTPAAATTPSNPPGQTNQVRGVVWSWPVSGKVLAGFAEAGSKGVKLDGKSGDAVAAAADGTVLFAGDPGGAMAKEYGNLVILKHANEYLSVYAHNSKITVKENQKVKRGQSIAQMGQTGSSRVQLHFEIREQGKPVDPARFLPGR